MLGREQRRLSKGRFDKKPDRLLRERRVERERRHLRHSEISRGSNEITGVPDSDPVRPDGQQSLGSDGQRRTEGDLSLAGGTGTLIFAGGGGRSREAFLGFGGTSDHSAAVS